MAKMDVKSEAEEPKLDTLLGKYESTKGILIWGKTSGDDYKAILVDDDGKLVT